MYFENTTPEAVGVSSAKILSFLKELERRRIPMHSLIIAKGNKIITEAYWKPFDASFQHRMYSQTKSFVGIAIGELAAEGKLSLDDRIVDYFPDKLPPVVHPWLQAQTIRHMLNMQTAQQCVNWFGLGVEDRVKYYFASPIDRYPGTTYRYDSTGSFVLGALIERLTGKTFLEYLQEKCLNEIGFSKDARCLYCPGGNAWSDSSLLCTTRDMLAFGRLLANGGEWNGKQLLNRENVTEATFSRVKRSSFDSLHVSNYGYGHQIWGDRNEGFGFHGMHGQYTFYDPKSDLLFSCTAAFAAGDDLSADLLSSGFFQLSDDDPDLSEDRSEELAEYISRLAFVTCAGASASSLESKIAGKTFVPCANPMGIREFRLEFSDDHGLFHYVNDQGEKSIRFGRCSNVAQLFPQTGYSKDIGGMPAEGHRYRCLASGAWKEETKLSILVTIADDYIGLLQITVSFHGGHVVVEMQKSAEDFLNEYEGCMTAPM